MQRVRACALHEHYSSVDNVSWSKELGEGGFARVRSAAGRRDNNQVRAERRVQSSDNANGEPARRGESSIARLFACETLRGENDKDYCFGVGEAGHRQCTKDMDGRVL
jgi:hypothetical protein